MVGGNAGVVAGVVAAMPEPTGRGWSRLLSSPSLTRMLRARLVPPRGCSIAGASFSVPSRYYILMVRDTIHNLSRFASHPGGGSNRGNQRRSRSEDISHFTVAKEVANKGRPLVSPSGIR